MIEKYIKEKSGKHRLKLQISCKNCQQPFFTRKDNYLKNPEAKRFCSKSCHYTFEKMDGVIDNLKFCIDCLIHQPLSKFKYKKDRETYGKICYDCNKLRKTKRYYETGRNLKYQYNISEEDFHNLRAGQNNLCKICNKTQTKLKDSGEPIDLVVDHCHKTNKVRGLLCNKCNVGLGMFKDNTELLKRAINYLDGIANLGS